MKAYLRTLARDAAVGILFAALFTAAEFMVRL
jgi:hypothetical protein